MFWQKNSTGTRKEEAKTIASFTSPWLIAPSPKQATEIRSSPRALVAIAWPTAWWVCAPMMTCGVAMWRAKGSQPDRVVPRQTESISAGSTPRHQAMPFSR